MSTMERPARATADDPVSVLAPVPEQTIDSVKADLAEIKEKTHR
ncbi:hypothetical protein [Streptomyces sp. NPDC089795]